MPYSVEYDKYDGAWDLVNGQTGTDDLPIRKPERPKAGMVFLSATSVDPTSSLESKLPSPSRLLRGSELWALVTQRFSDTCKMVKMFGNMSESTDII